MPTLNDILALSAAGGSTGTSDINAFNQSVIASDPFGIAGRSVDSWQPDMRTWSPSTQGITSFTKSFLGGLLGNVARSDAADQVTKLASVLPQLDSANAVNVGVPEGVDPGAFNTFKINRMEKRQATSENIRQALADTLGLNYDTQTGKVSDIPRTEGGDVSTAISDLAIAKKKQAGDKPLTPAALQKISAGTSMLGQINKAKDYVNQMTDNPQLAGIASIPGIGPYLSELAGGTERGFQETRNSTPEGQYGALMQLIQEGSGKFISNSARQAIINENLKNASPSKTGTKNGLLDILQNTQDVIAQDLLDQASGASEQHYNKIKDAVEKAQLYQSADPTSAPDTSTQAQPVPTGQFTKSGKAIYTLNGVKGTID